MRVSLIANPKAGRGRALRAAQTAAALLREAGWEVTLAPTAGPGDATNLARAAEAHDLVVACGGDGTLSEVISGALPGDVPVGLIPSGTGNDFARAVGLSHDPAEAARQLLAGAPRRVDLMVLDAPAARAVNIIGIGFDAAVATRMNRQSRAGGGCIPYLSAVMAELVHLRPVKLRLRVDEETWEGEALLVAIANAQSYGGGMRVAPDARIDDGLLDIVIVEPLGRLDFLRTLPKVFKGTHLQHPAVSCRRGREIVVESDEPVPALVDGDVRAQTPLQVTVAPGAVKLWLPPT